MTQTTTADPIHNILAVRKEAKGLTPCPYCGFMTNQFSNHGLHDLPPGATFKHGGGTVSERTKVFRCRAMSCPSRLGEIPYYHVIPRTTQAKRSWVGHRDARGEVFYPPVITNPHKPPTMSSTKK